MRRDAPISPFDVEAQEAQDITQQFWGDSRAWAPRRPSPVAGAPDTDRSDVAPGDDPTGSLQAIREGFRAFRPKRIARPFDSGQVERTRAHGVVRSRPSPEPASSTGELTLGQLASGWGVDDDVDPPARADQPPGRRDLSDHDDRRLDHGLVPLSPVQPLADRIGLGAVDPLLARVAVMIVVGLLLVPIALTLRSQADQPLTGSLAAGALPNVATPADQPATGVSVRVAPVPAVDTPVPAESSAASEGSSSTQTAPDATPAPTPVAAVETDLTPEAAPSTSTDPTATTSPAVGDVTQATAAAGAAAATVSAPAERQVPACPSTYVAGSGDSWYRIADAAGVTPSALLAENRATVHTVILPGDDICLPAGATMPSPPSTTTQPPATTQPPVTTAPATTQPPVTSTPASPAQVQQMIRDIWPDELEEKALQIAWRESNYIATAYNGFCCYGVFQIYWSVHVRWLDEYGIYSSSDLLDARKNITAAYALYQRAGGWGPWGG